LILNANFCYANFDLRWKTAKHGPENMFLMRFSSTFSLFEAFVGEKQPGKRKLAKKKVNLQN